MIESEEVVQNCSNNEVTYKINFITTPESFAVLTIINYGVVIPKGDSNSVTFDINKEQKY